MYSYVVARGTGQFTVLVRGRSTKLISSLDNVLTQSLEEGQFIRYFNCHMSDLATFLLPVGVAPEVVQRRDVCAD